jgi:hypothetical protein
MKRLPITIETAGGTLSRDLHEAGLSLGGSVGIGEGSSVEFIEENVRKGFDATRTLELVITTLSSGVAIDLVSSWLYERLKGRSAKLRIRRTEVHIDRGEITRVITEEIEKS